MTTQTTFLALTPSLRATLATTIENLINLLDEIEGDPDAEPTLGAPERGGWYVSQEHWTDGACGDHEREDVSEGEGAACDDGAEDCLSLC